MMNGENGNFEQSDAFVKSKEKFEFKKEMIGIIIAIVILIILVVILINQVFFTKKYEVIIPDLPTNDKVGVGVADYSDNSINANDLSAKKTKELKVSYEIISDYYKKGILLGNTQVNYLNDDLIITSGIGSQNAFISKASTSAKLDWITKFENKKYSKINVAKTISHNKNYFVVATGDLGNNKVDIIVYKVNESGSIEKSVVVREKVEARIQDAIVVGNKIAIVTYEEGNILVQTIDENIVVDKKLFNLSDTHSNVVNATYETAAAQDGILSLILYANSMKIRININFANGTSEAIPVDGVNSLGASSKPYAAAYLNGFIYFSENGVYKYNEKDELVNKFDYSSLKLEDKDEYKKKHQNSQDFDEEEFDSLVNKVYVQKVSVIDDKIIVKFQTAFTRAYDIYDKDLKLLKRYTFDADTETMREGLLLNTIFVDNKIYEIYSFGSETPSIMISQIS